MSIRSTCGSIPRIPRCRWAAIMMTPSRPTSGITVQAGIAEERSSTTSSSVRSAAEMGSGFVVEPGTVIVTHPGNLRRSNNVKAVLHVAAQHGEPGRGYTTIRSYENCVKNALDAADDINRGLSYRLRLKQPSKSIIFPLFGTRNFDDDPQVVALNLVRAAKNYLETWPHCTIERVYFLAWTDADEELCLIAFQRLGLNFEKVEPDESAAQAEQPAAAESARTAGPSPRPSDGLSFH